MDIYAPLVSKLRQMTEAQAKSLGERAGVPWGTLAKIKYGQTSDPGIKTVEKLMANIEDPRQAA